eukprot:gene3451-13509_t
MQTALRRAASIAHRIPASRLTSVRCKAMSAPPPPPKYSLLEYKYVSDILEKRGPYRDDHIAGAKKAEAAGKLVMAGAFGAPDGALFIWSPVATEDEIKAFAEADPYVINGLVPSWWVSRT